MQSNVCNIWGIPTTAQHFDDAITQLQVWSNDGQHYVCTCPVYTLMRGVEDDAIGAALRGAAMIAADGMPVVWLQRRRCHPAAERVYGPDVMLALCAATANTATTHLFYGGMPGVPQALAAKLQTRYPGLNVAGAIAPPTIEIGTTPDTQVIAKLNATEANVIWVGLGSPKQDLWMRLYRPHLDAPLLIGVGAAFDFLAGTKQQAPRYLQRAGLEWLYRLASEPRRLWRRYLVYNTRFVLRVLRDFAP